MKDLPKIQKIGWLLTGAAVLALLLTVLVSLVGGAGVGFLFWIQLLLILPVGLVGLALLAYHWFIISKRTGRRL